jgi:hypothetical protein
MKRYRALGRGSWSRTGTVVVLTTLLVGVFGGTALAAPGFDVTIPIDTIVRADEGSVTPFPPAVDVPSEAVGQQCSVLSQAANQESVHPNNDLLVDSGSSQVILPNVEAVQGGTVVGDGTLTLGDTILVSLRMGGDEVFSGGFDVIIDCDPLPGRIVVVKEVTDGSDTTQSFEFTASYDADGFALADAEQNDSGDLDAGVYVVSETVPAGWTLESAACDDGSPVDAIDLGEGETVTCTFTNDEEPPPPPDPGRIVVVKEVTEGSDVTQSFDFTASYDIDGFSLSDGQQNDSGDLEAGIYSVSEALPAGWTLESAVCDDLSPVDAIDLQAGETVTCTFVNQAVEDEVMASILVTIGGDCAVVGDDGVGEITVTMSVAGGADVVVRDADGNLVDTFDSDGSVEVPEGEVYTWEATANEGFEFPPGFDPTGSVSIETCSNPEVLPFTGPVNGTLVPLGTALIGAGLAILFSMRRREEL